MDFWKLISTIKQHAIIISFFFIPSVHNLFPTFSSISWWAQGTTYLWICIVSIWSYLLTFHLFTLLLSLKFSIYLQLQLACDEWRRSMIGTVQTIGGLLSLPITGFISDHCGRRFALSFNALNITWLGLVRYWVNNYNVFLVVEILKSTLGGGGFSCAYILGTSSFIYFLVPMNINDEMCFIMASVN